MPTQGPDLYYWANPNILKMKGTSAWKFSNIDAIRKSQLIGEKDKDVARGTKAIDFLVAMDAHMGIKMDLPDDEKEELRDIFNNAFHGEGLKDKDGNLLFAKGTDLTIVGGEIDLSKLEDERRERLQKKGLLTPDGKLKYQYDLRTRKQADKLMRYAYEGKNPTEILRMRGKHWQTPAVYRILGRDQMRDMNVNKDNGEKEPYLEWIMEEREKELAGVDDPANPGTKYKMSEQTKSVLDWLKKNDRYAAEYLPGHKYKGRDVREILGVRP